MNEFDEMSDLLCRIISEAREQKDRKQIAFVRKLWDGESWERICAKLDTEGSTWVVWWSDGVNALARYLKNQEGT